MDSSLAKTSGKDESSTMLSTTSNTLGVASNKYQRLLGVFVYILPFLPIVILVTQSCLLINFTTIKRQQFVEVDRQMTESTDLVEMISKIQIERLAMAYFIIRKKNETEYENILNKNPNISKIFGETDEALSKMKIWRNFNNVKLFSSKIRFQIRLDDFREKVFNRMDPLNPTDLSFYNDVNEKFLLSLGNSIQIKSNTKSWRYLLSYKNLIRGIENLGKSLNHCLFYYLRGFINEEGLLLYLRFYTVGKEYFSQTQNFVPYASVMFKAIEKKAYWKDFAQGELDILEGNFPTSKKNSRITGYYYAANKYFKDLRVIQEKLRNDIREITFDEVESTIKKQGVAILALVLVMCISPFLILLIRNASSGLKHFMLSVKTKARDLRHEKHKSQKLLYKMLPETVVKQLKVHKTTAESFDSVTIFFSHLNGFGLYAATNTAMDIVGLLNRVHKVSDETINQYDVYKVETIRDQYMVTSGVPEKNGDDHAGEIAKMAITLRKTIHMMPSIKKYGLQIQCGIHTGPCVAGVIGTKMPRYCLFGDTVNTASRMGTRGEPGKIHVSSDTQMILSTLGGYKLELRGTIDVKGKGDLETFWLISSTHITPETTIPIEDTSISIDEQTKIEDFF